MKLTKTQIYIIAIAAAAIIFVGGLEALTANKIAYGIKAADISLGGLSREQAIQKLVAETNKLGNGKINLSYKDKTWQASLFELGVNPDIEATVEAAYSITRTGSWFKNVKVKIKGVFSEIKIPITASINEDAFQNYYSKNLIATESPRRDASLRYNATIEDFEAAPAKTGNVINRTKLKSDVSEAFSRKKKSIEIVFQKDLPRIVEKDLTLAYLKASLLIKNTPYRIGDEEQYWDVDKEQLIEWIDFSGAEVELNKEKIKYFLTRISPALRKEPINAILTVKNGRVSAFALSQNGVALNVEKSVENVVAGLMNGAKNINFAFDETEPQITTDKIDNLGLTSLIGAGTSNFAGSPANRIHNIRLGTAKYNGIFMAPGEEFSFNEILGEVGAAQGYKAELVIKSGKTIPEYGGGICQVSTTAFRAAVNSGLKITKRYPHSYVVKYYGKPGFDATIYPPSPDLKFVNNTPSNILIQTRIDKKLNLTFEIYGTDDGRKVELEGPIVLDKHDDGSMRTKLVQNVYDKDGEQFIKQFFYSNYKSPKLYPIVRNPLE